MGSCLMPGNDPNGSNWFCSLVDGHDGDHLALSGARVTFRWKNECDATADLAWALAEANAWALFAASSNATGKGLGPTEREKFDEADRYLAEWRQRFRREVTP